MDTNPPSFAPVSFASLTHLLIHSLDVESTNVSDLDDSQKQVLMDWEKRFLTVKKYPVVGTC